MKRFFDNVRGNNKTCETREEEWDVLRCDINHLRGCCGNSETNVDTDAMGFFATEKTRLYKILHDL